jgi:hypothetical protein
VEKWEMTRTRRIIETNNAERHLRSVIVKTTVDRKEILTKAFGESITGVPAMTDMHFRNGAVAISQRVDPAVDARRREEGEPRRQGVELASRSTPRQPEPALHAFTSERRATLGLPARARFYEESTFWNPSWTITRGAVQTTNISDLNSTAVAIGTGKLLSPESYQKMISTARRGTSTSVPGCTTCVPQQEGYSYGLGIVTTGNWLMQNLLFSREAGAFAYLPSQKIAIAVTFTENAFAAGGSYRPVVTTGRVVWIGPRKRTSRRTRLIPTVSPSRTLDARPSDRTGSRTSRTPRGPTPAPEREGAAQRG